MPSRKLSKQPTERLLTICLGVAVLSVAGKVPAVAEEGGSPLTQEQSTRRSGAGESLVEKPALPGGATGMRVYVDPTTGAVRPDPAPGSLMIELTPAEQAAVSSSHQGLVEVPSSEPGGGVKLDLQGRFQSPLIGTIDSGGNLRIHHLPETPELPSGSRDK